MRGNAGPMILMLTVVALFGGLAWLTNHPDADIVRRAESWPLVGDLARQFRQSYGISPPGDGLQDRLSQDESEEGSQRQGPVIPPIGEGYVWVVPGTVLHQERDQTSKKILQFDAIANVTRLEKKGDWYRVWRRGQEGWVYLEGYSDDIPPYGSEPEPVRPLPSQAPKEQALAVARSYFGEGERLLDVGPYRLYTDSRDEELLARLDQVASRLEATYIERSGRSPVDSKVEEAVILYRNEHDYRRLQNHTDRLIGLLAGGHTASGLVVLYAGGRSPWEVVATLIHELAHTLNRRAIGPALPSWLDEGLADDLAFSAVNAVGEIQLGSLGGERLRVDGEITLKGGLASLWDLRDKAREGHMPGILQLLHLDWEAFVRSDRVATHYAAAAFWIRFLFDGDDGRMAEPFRAYLDSVSRGEPAAAEALRQRLDMPWNVLDARYQLWIDFQRPTATLIESSQAHSRQSFLRQVRIASLTASFSAI